MPLAVMRRVTEVYFTTILLVVVVVDYDDDGDRCWIFLMIMRRKIEFFSEISELWTSSFFFFFLFVFLGFPPLFFGWRRGGIKFFFCLWRRYVSISQLHACVARFWSLSEGFSFSEWRSSTHSTSSSSSSSSSSIFR